MTYKCTCRICEAGHTAEALIKKYKMDKEDSAFILEIVSKMSDEEGEIFSLN